MQADKDEITAVEMPAMKLPETALPAVRWPSFGWPEVKWVDVKWPKSWRMTWQTWARTCAQTWATRLPAMKWPAPGYLAALSPRNAMPEPALAVLDKFASYRLPASATRTMLPLVLAIGVLLLSMARVEFLPASEAPVNDINGSKFAPVAANELDACQAQSWPNFSPECIKSPTQLAAARRVDVR